MNLMTERPGRVEILVSNLFFLGGTVVIALSITHVKHKLARQEFFLRSQLAASNEELGRSERALTKARDALWSEMEVAKRIQTSLLPQGEVLAGFDVAATMLPAEEVGGDYYDFIPTTTGGWIMIGDVSGHGVESGLIMMMAQMSVQSVVHGAPDVTPAELLARINPVIKKNISRLGTARYMTASAILLRAGQMTISGMHQDVMIYRARTATTERVKTEGVWIGVLEDSAPYLSDVTVDLEEEDIIMLFTDGITEATNEEGEMFGEERLEALLRQYAELPVERIVDTILRAVATFQSTMHDDMTLVVARRRNNAEPPPFGGGGSSGQVKESAAHHPALGNGDAQGEGRTGSRAGR
jgi:phosphoserine phosphatase RsbU/P